MVAPNGLTAYFAALYWLIDKHQCVYGVWLIPASVLVNGILKWCFRVPRPGWSDPNLGMKVTLAGVCVLDVCVEYLCLSSHSICADFGIHNMIYQGWSHEYSFPSGHSQLAWALATFFGLNRVKHLGYVYSITNCFLCFIR